MCQTLSELMMDYGVGVFTRRSTANLPEGIPLPVKVFIIWLVVILWKRESDSAAAT